MTPQQVAREIESLIQAANKALEQFLDKTQSEIYNAALIDLKKLELNDEGYVLANSANRKIIKDVSKSFDRALQKAGYETGLSKFILTINSIDKINTSYFKGVDKSFNPKSLNVSSLQKETISQIGSLLLNDGLESQIKQPLINILNQNINTGGSYTGMVEQVKGYIKGVDQNEGKLMRYAKQISQDALNNYSRSYQRSVGNFLGLEFYVYLGGLMPESREFCRDRAGGYFHQKEIESWAKLEWKGKRSDTTESSIFVYAGGYVCKHSIVPVSVSVVPKAMIDRAKELGFYQSN